MAASPSARILFWAAMISLACGAIEFGAPLDRLLHNARDAVRAHDSDRSIVVVEVNNRSLRAIDVLGSRRSVDAALLEQLFRLGAQRVFFDKVYTDPSPAGDDAVLARSIARHPGRVFIATRFEQNRHTGTYEPLLPVPMLRAVAQLGSINAWRDPLGYTSRLPFRSKIGSRAYPSYSTLLAGVKVASDSTYAPDFSIEYASIPSVNVLDALHRTSPAMAAINGHDVIVAKTSDSLGDTHIAPRQGPVPGVYIQVIGAETLKRGVPINVGWLPPFLAALLTAFVYLKTGHGAYRVAIATAAVSVMIVVPLLLDGWHVEMQIVPATLLIGIVLVRARIMKRVAIHPLTGLPNLSSIVRDGSVSSRTLIGLKIGNYADLRATLDDMEERVLLREVIRRVKVSGDPIELMHGGDTFVWKTDLIGGGCLFDHLEGLHALLSSPVNLGDRMVDLTLGFGIEDGFDRPLTQRVGSLQVTADEALAAGAKWRLHDPRRLEDANFRQSLLSRLDLALHNGEIWVAYQPKLDLRTKQISGAEALVRWSHPDRGLIPPDQFVPVAEQANRIAGLTYFVLETAVRNARQLDAVDELFSVAVNLSVRMLSHADLASNVQAVLVRHGLSPHRLTLEITENEEIDPLGPDIAMLRSLRALGVHLSIDDYGTKYSTLDYVRQLPASEIKIDQRFVGAVHQDRNAWIMAQSTVELAHSLGLTVVAEGVETGEILSALIDMGCDVAQGFLIGRPIRFDELERFLSATRLRRVG